MKNMNITMAILNSFHFNLIRRIIPTIVSEHIRSCIYLILAKVPGVAQVYMAAIV